jgi:hypothetical protein
MRRSRILTGLGTCLLALALLIPSAAAATVTSDDPAGDGQGVGDLRALRVSQHPNTLALTFQVRTNLPFNPDGPAWNSAASVTSLNFNIATDGGREVDYQIQVFATGSGPEVEVLAIAHSPAPRGLCGFDLSFPQPTIIRVQLNAPLCVGEPDTLRAFARFWFDRGGNGSIDSDDRVRNRGYSPPLDVTLTN